MPQHAHDLQTVRVPVGDLVPYPGNSRQGDVGAVCQSLEAHGQFRPLVVQRSTMQVLAGNHTLEAARQLKWPEVAVHLLDVDDEQARRINLIDNRTSDLATNDDAALAELLQSLVDTDAGLDGTGFDGDDLDDLMASLEPAERPEDGAGEGGDPEPDVYAIGVVCQSEDYREELMARLTEWGYEPRKIDGRWMQKGGGGGEA